MEDYSGEKFLDKLYQNLHISDEVQHTAVKSNTNAENIKLYLERLDRVSKKAYKQKRLSLLKHFYYKKYVIKAEDIPEDVITNLTDDEIINEQKKSLDSWIDYLCSDFANYPAWAKYWVFQGMLNIGKYNELYDPYDNTGNKNFKNAFSKRSRKSISPFIECDPELIAKAIELMIKYNHGKNLNDEEIEKLVSTGSFAKIYGRLLYNSKKNLKDKSDSQAGVWIKYNQGSEEDAKRLCESLQGFHTKWCTAGEDTALKQVCGPYDDAPKGGDFYVYYTKDKNGEYKVPRIAIRLIDKSNIAEIRGVAESQNLEEGLESILSKKLEMIDSLSKEDKIKALRTTKDLQILTEIDKKNLRGEDLTVDELLLIYSDRIIGFGWQEDPRILKIIETRNEKRLIQKDFDNLPSLESKINCLNKIYFPINDFLISDYKVALAVISKKGEVIKYVSKSIMDENLILLALETYSYALEYILKNFNITKEFATKCISKAGSSLTKILSINSSIVDKNMLIMAVQDDVYVIADIPKEMHDADLYAIAAENGMFSSLKKELINDDALLELLNRDINYIKKISWRWYTKDIILLVARYYDNPEDIITSEWIDLDVAFALIENDWRYIKKIPKEFITYDLAKVAISKSGKAIQYIPEELVDNYLCVLALKTYKDALFYSEDTDSKEIIIGVLNIDGMLISAIPDEYIDYDVAKAAVLQNSAAIDFIPKDKDWYDNFISEFGSNKKNLL